jgi:type VI secretion system secreted protein VgrG
MSATSTPSQGKRQVQVGTPLGLDDLMFHKMVAREGLSQLYELDLELFSIDPKIAPSKILGKNITVAWKWDPDGETRYFTGTAIKFGLARGEGKMSVYRCIVAPPMWLLTQNRNSRIFEEMATKDIIKKVLGEYSITADVMEGLGHAHEYCVQWNESDYDFICRLMERHGAYFYFKHEDGVSKLCIVKAGHAHGSMAWHEAVEVRDPGGSYGANLEHISHWGMQGQIRPDTSTMQDYNFKEPRANLEKTKTVSPDYTLGAVELYDYHGGYSDTGVGVDLVTVTAQASQADALVYQGVTNARSVGPGWVFAVKGDRVDWMTEKNMLTVSSEIELVQPGYDTRVSGGDTRFACTMTAVAKSVKWNAPQITPWPRIHGPQTAVVVNKNGQDLDVDEWGRVRVSFNWEREGTSSMLTRVSQMWAGAEWGGIAWPRKGQEVIVEHLNGDPDRPIITGRVYNDAAKPTHDPTSKASIFSIKSRTIGGGGFNALEFEDKAGKEYVFMHSQKDTHLRTTESHYELIGKEEHQVVTKDAMRKVDADQHQTIKGDNKLTVKGANHFKVTSDQLVSSDANVVTQAGQNVHIKAGMNVTIEGGVNVTLKVGGNFIAITPAGVDIKGVMVKVNSGGAAGSGPGTKAAAAKAPKDPMEGKPGAEAPEATKRDWAAVVQTIDSNPAAAALLAAADSGAPFCAVCEKARQDEEAARQANA